MNSDNFYPKSANFYFENVGFPGVPWIGYLTTRLDQKEASMIEKSRRRSCVGQIELNSYIIMLERTLIKMGVSASVWSRH